MIRVTVEVGDGDLSRRLSITAASIEQALEMAGEGEARVLFPIEPEAFFVGDLRPQGLTEPA